MDAVLTPRRAPRTDVSPLASGFDQMARIVGAALGDTPPISARTELFRPLPADPMSWLLQTFPAYFQNAQGEPVPMAPHHEAFWQWLWGLRPGSAAQTFIAIWPRGGGKSTGLEIGSAVCGYFGLRRYVIYVCSTQKQADDHVANVATLLESLGVDRAINRYGFSRGWNINRLRTADGYTQDAIGLDVAARGLRIDFSRPDGVFLDELDEQLDKPETTEKKIDILTRKILPTGDSALAVAGVQNLPNKDGIFSQLADGRAEFLMDRVVSGPHPALAELPEQDWYVTQHDADSGVPRFTLPAGTPVWQGQDRAACEHLLNAIGPRAFEIECLHRIGRMSGKIFRREWFRVVEDWPRQATLVRYWDFAATEEPAYRKNSTKDPDWTVGLLLAAWEGQFWVLDMQRVRASPFEVEQLVRQTAAVDGWSVEIWLEEEGGASGKAATAHYQRRVLVGYAVRTWHSTGSKTERAKPVSAAAQAGNVFLLHGYWNQPWLDEVCRFGLPGVHDDIVDALSGAHYALTLGGYRVPQDLDLNAGLARMSMASLETRAQRGTAFPGLARLWGGLDTTEDLEMV